MTPSGNYKAPSRELKMTWLSWAWSQITTQIITNGFKAYDVTTSLETEPLHAAGTSINQVPEEENLANSLAETLVNEVGDASSDVDDDEKAMVPQSDEIIDASPEHSDESEEGERSDTSADDTLPEDFSAGGAEFLEYGIIFKSELN